MPFPILGVDSDNGSEFINHHLLTWCETRQSTFTRSRPGNSNDGAHVEGEELGNRPHRGRLPPLRHPGKLVLLNKIWVLQSQLTNYFYPQQKLISKVRHGAKVTKTYDTATTPYRRAEGHQTVSIEDKTIMADTLAGLNPVAIQRQIQALTAQLLTLTTSKASSASKPALPASTTRASVHESTKPATRAS